MIDLLRAAHCKLARDFSGRITQFAFDLRPFQLPVFEAQSGYAGRFAFRSFVPQVHCVFTRHIVRIKFDCHLIAIDRAGKRRLAAARPVVLSVNEQGEAERAAHLISSLFDV